MIDLFEEIEILDDILSTDDVQKIHEIASNRWKKLRDKLEKLEAIMEEKYLNEGIIEEI